MVSLRIKLFAVFSLLLLSISISSVVAQSPYDGAITTNITIGSDGTTTVVDNFGVTYFIQGQPGARDRREHPTSPRATMLVERLRALMPWE